VLEFPRREASKGGSAPTPAGSVPPPDTAQNQPPATAENYVTEIDPVATASSSIKVSSPVDSPKPRGGFSPPRPEESPLIDQRGVASVVQPPAIVAPAALVNPFQKAWLR
jgi:hypothetical protein